MTALPEVEERIEALEAWLLELDARALGGAPILVEGEKDEAALRSLGVTGPILRVQGPATVFAFAEALARDRPTPREAVVLTDWDRAGGRLARKLAEALAANGIRADLTSRATLAYWAREIRHVESLGTYLRTLRERGGHRPWDGSE